MRNSDVPMMTLRRAVEWCGGIDALGDALNTTAESLERWLSGEEEVPTPVFLQAVGLILEASASQPPGRSTPDSSDGGRRENRH
ncbi:MAG: helix-turn-helix domain-containing protein [Betaproteobacteria bacterium]|nr:MAG: helix-turn-helix domain-containing protein [Betaproteobacteria bacterium]